MGEESYVSDRALQQAMVALKKGAHLFKYGRRGKPKFCLFKLSMDEKFLIWYSGQEEKKLRLSSVTNIIQGLQNTTLSRQVQIEKESQCLSLIYANGKRSLELICKDKVEAECWFMGLRAIISQNNPPSPSSITIKRQKGGQSCISSPVAFITRKTKSLSGSPPSSFSCSRRMLKDVYAWGENANALQPKLVDSTIMFDVHTLSLGNKHVALVTEQGEVFCWTESDIDSKLVDSLTGIHVNNITCGGYQTCALTVSGECYTWGGNNESNNPWLPRRLSGVLDGLTISKVACGEWHAAIVSECGRLFTYGDGTFGALGHGNLQSYKHPKQVESIRDLHVRTIACGPWHTAAVISLDDKYSTSGKLFTWGDSNREQKVLVPTCVSKLFDHDFVEVSCGDTMTVGLTATGRVYTIGASIVAVELEEFVVQVSSGCFHVVVLTSNGNVYTWGQNKKGQLGLGDVKYRNSPCLVEALKGRKVERVVCGSSSTAAICRHKSLTTVDQLCGNVFGFTRKKHNCYNCGRLFCRSCCGKMSMHASLALNETQPFRVCNGCFNHLQNASCPVVLSKVEGSSTPRPTFITHSQRKLDSNQVQDHILEDLQRWGRVSCPQVFGDAYEGNYFLRNKSSFELSLERGSNKLEMFLSNEISKLKAQVDSLEELCRTRKEKIQENQQKIEEARLLAKKGASKCKEVNEIVQALTSKLCEMSEKNSTRREVDSRFRK